MHSDWCLKTLGGIATNGGYGLVDGPFGSNLPASLYTSQGIPVIRGSNLSLGTLRFRADEFVFVSIETARRLERSLCKPYDIVFTKKGTLGQTGLIPRNSTFDTYLLSSNQMKLTVDCSIADPLFVYYYVSSPESVAKITRDAESTGVPKTNVTYLREFPIALPPLPEQRAIASILGALDDKIDLNRRMNETLEAMAQALFKDWFVDFGPTRAKMESREPYLAPELWALFPDRLDDKGKPEGWRDSVVGEICHVVDCLHSKKPRRQDAGETLLQLNNIRDDGLLDLADRYCISAADYQFWTSRIEASFGDCVVTNVGRVGAVSQVPEDVKAALGRNMTGVRCKPESPYPTFLICMLLSSAMKEEIERWIDTGTILNALNVRSIPRLRFVLPQDELARCFESLARPLRAKMEDSLQESRTLAQLRDLLLPKLMSGEIRVRDAERMVEDVV